MVTWVPAVVPSIHVRSAVNRHFVLVRARAINIERVQPARPRSMAIKDPGHTRDQLHVVQHVAPIDSDIVQLFAGDQVGALARIGLKLYLTAIGRDRYFIGGGPNVEHKITGIQFPSCAEHETVGFEFFEAWSVHSHDVSTRKEVGGDEFSRISGGQLAGQSIAGIRNGDRRTLIMAPVESCTRPVMVPEVTCANIEMHRKSVQRMTQEMLLRIGRFSA